MLEYDLVRVFDHPLKFRHALAAAIALFGGKAVGSHRLKCQWRRCAGAVGDDVEMMLHWNTATLRPHFAEVEEEIAILSERSEDRAQLVEEAAIIAAVAVMSQLAPETRLTHWARVGTAHDFQLNDTRQEMLEVKGRFKGGLPGLFNEAKSQSEQKRKLAKRWVSVTVFTKRARNRTEGLHS